MASLNFPRLGNPQDIIKKSFRDQGRRSVKRANAFRVIDALFSKEFSHHISLPVNLQDLTVIKHCNQLSAILTQGSWRVNINAVTLQQVYHNRKVGLNNELVDV